MLTQISSPPFTLHSVSLADAELTHAHRDVEHTIEKTDFIITKMNEFGQRYWLCNVILLKAKGLLTLEPPIMEAAWDVLSEVRDIAEETGTRQVLWEILATLRHLAPNRGDVNEAKTLRAQTREAIAFIADNANPEDLRESFLNRADVKSRT